MGIAEHYTAPRGTLPLLSGILHWMDFAHRDMIAIIADLPDDALRWHPADAMSTLSGMICHTMYCETYAIRRAAGEDVAYDGVYDEAEEDGSTWRTEEDRAQLIARIAQGDAVMKRLLPIMTVAGMEERYPAWGANAIVSGGELIAKVAIHTGLHWGHMQMTRQLWEQGHPEFVGSYTPW
ncbi:MAG: DinB family protein [Thermomicrobia bacterium]|nr:DinB family protein [Thermomicrobia bacterium]